MQDEEQIYGASPSRPDQAATALGPDGPRADSRARPGADWAVLGLVDGPLRGPAQRNRGGARSSQQPVPPLR